ncbi:MAG: hypothetical protein NC209_07820 [Alistipes sp.]|nr:hypothetical protein [Alistipes senegalensis]MCM1251033.1 hypothetical protein [Alistipes sp.]
MKRLLLMLLSAATLLSACENDNDRGNPLTPTQEKVKELITGHDDPIDMSAFLETVQRGVWIFDTIDITYTDGTTYDGLVDGGREIAPMMLLPGGECRIFLNFMFNPRIPILYQTVAWSVSENRADTIELYSEELARESETGRYDRYEPATTLQLLYYQDGVFIMKGLQPTAYSSPQAYQGIYKDYCMVCGHIATDEETVARYRAYESYDAYREQHPDMFP